MTSRRNPISSSLGRRMFLGGACSAAGALPFLSSFELQAGGLEAAPPKVLLVGFENGPLVGADGSANYDGWRPGGIELPEGELPEILPDVFEGLSPYRDDLVFLENISFLDDNTHRQTSGMLTGRQRYVPPGQAIEQYSASGISVDQYLAQELGIGVLNTAFNISGFALGESYWSYTGQNQPVTPIQNPVDAYTQVFGEGLDDSLAAEVLARRTSVLDVIAQDLQTMKARTPKADRARLEAHLQSVRELELDLINGANSGCSQPDAIPDYAFLDHANAPMVVRDHASVITQAFACGAAQFATLQLGSFGGETRPQWPELGIDSNYTAHAICHAFDGIDGAGSAGLSQAQGIELGLAKERAYTQLFAEVLGKLHDTIDVDGRPLIDNTLVLYVRPMGRNHDSNRILWIAAGGDGVGVRGGRFMQVGDGGGNRRYYNDMLTTICATMGHPVDTFGDASFCRQPIDLS